MTLTDKPTADVSVRLAWAADAPDIAAVQVTAWQQSYADVLPSHALAALPADQFESRWRESITHPKAARQRVLVALERAALRGFVATAPATDPDTDPVSDAEIAELVIDPRHRGVGHGSRLLHAAVDTMRSDRFARATIWLNSTDDDQRQFLVDQGWAPDGAHRELDLHGDGSVLVKQLRLHTALTRVD
ncbi:MAG: GNAT family N-acetyltransferase [Nocardioidaceae bacterium]